MYVYSQQNRWSHEEREKNTFFISEVEWCVYANGDRDTEVHLASYYAYQD